MKKFILLSFIFTILASSAYAGGGMSRMANPSTRNELNVLRRTLMQKQTFSTQRKTKGYVPEHQHFNQRVPFRGLPNDARPIDEKGEYFYSPSMSKPTPEVSDVRQEGDHTIVVNLMDEGLKKK
ncbi:MAG: hypothetical protein K2P93_06430 [Alphaproteobacteria bacterium]|nr:hypothetical protein [Alphaproteobacteria bacterium]